MATLSEIADAMPGVIDPGDFLKVSTTSEGAGTWLSLWKVASTPPPATTNPPTGNGECPTDATLGAFPLNANAGAGESLRCAYISADGSQIGALSLYDRLWHNSGFVGNVTTAQTIAAFPGLTRATDGLGVEVWLEVYTAMGATGSVFTVTGVDPDNNAATWTYTMPANALTVGQMVRCTAATGASAGKGCKSVSQLQLSVSTGTAGNVGITLMKRITTCPLNGTGLPLADRDFAATRMSKVENDACLFFVVRCSATTTGLIQGDLAVVKVAD